MTNQAVNTFKMHSGNVRSFSREKTKLRFNLPNIYINIIYIILIIIYITYQTHLYNHNLAIFVATCLTVHD